MKRKFIKQKKSRKMFKRTSGTHGKNLKPRAMRGTNRL
jgi:hypothetical protein